MATVKLRVDFYEVETADAEDFWHILQVANRLPKRGKRRNVEINGRTARLTIGKEFRTSFSGDIIRIRMDNLPRKATLNGDVDDLPLAADEGLGEETAFRYSAAYHILALQRNRFGVGPSAFATYFERLLDMDGTIQIKPILALDAETRLERMRDIRKFRLSVSGKSTIEHLETLLPNETGKRVLQLARELNAVNMILELSAGRSLMGLTDRIKEFARCLRGGGGSGARHIQLTGLLDNDVRETIDLVADFLGYEENVEVVDRRKLSFSLRSGVVQNAWHHAYPEIRSRYGNNEGQISQ